MSDTIKRSDAINLCEKWRNRTNEHHDKNGWYIANTLLSAIKNLPSADRPQGEWIIHFDDLFPTESTQECSICHAKQIINENDDNFCPNCGADMRGEQNG